MTSDVKDVGFLLCASNDKLVTAESCTGGRIATCITEIAGASSWFAGGWVTYSNALKMSQLGVAEELLQMNGAVSSQVAEAMCVGAIRQSGATVALSTTGIAGPTGGTEDKPVGTVFIGCVRASEIEVRRFLFSGNRIDVQKQATIAALKLLHELFS
ncbi:MAG: CinA family protein [Planctomycetes bacterium]|nr:CinA family protein [Planctomycetota bacterium]